MPTRVLDDGIPVVEFDPRVEVSPYTVFRRLKDGQPLLLVDVRVASALPLPAFATLRGAIAMTTEWTPPEGDVVLFDDDGTIAVPMARALQAQGHERVRALFGGLELYGFALDPEVVGADTFLVIDRRP